MDTETENSSTSADRQDDPQDDRQDDRQEETHNTTVVRHRMTNIQAQVTTQGNAHVPEITTHIARDMTPQIDRLHDKQYRALHHAVPTLTLTSTLLQTLPLHD